MIDGRLIKITNKSAGHFANSGYSEGLRRSNPKIYQDKMNVSSSIDEVIKGSRDYVNEELKHDRDDDIVEFARGSVLLDVGGNKYEASALVGDTTQGEMLFYDAQDMVEAKFELKEKRYSENRPENSRSGKTTVPLKKSISEDGAKNNIIYVQKNRSLATAIDEQAFINTPEATSGTASTNIIFNNEQKSNIEISVTDAHINR